MAFNKRKGFGPAGGAGYPNIDNRRTAAVVRGMLRAIGRLPAVGPAIAPALTAEQILGAEVTPSGPTGDNGYSIRDEALGAEVVHLLRRMYDEGIVLPSDGRPLVDEDVALLLCGVSTSTFGKVVDAAEAVFEGGTGIDIEAASDAFSRGAGVLDAGAAFIGPLLQEVNRG